MTASDDRFPPQGQQPIDPQQVDPNSPYRQTHTPTQAQGIGAGGQPQQYAQGHPTAGAPPVAAPDGYGVQPTQNSFQQPHPSAYHQTDVGAVAGGNEPQSYQVPGQEGQVPHSYAQQQTVNTQTQAPETDLYGQPGGYHYPQTTGTEAAAPINNNLAGGAPANLSQQPNYAPQFDAYQPPALAPAQPTAQVYAQPNPLTAQPGLGQQSATDPAPIYETPQEPDYSVSPTAPPGMDYPQNAEAPAAGQSTVYQAEQASSYQHVVETQPAPPGYDANVAYQAGQGGPGYEQAWVDPMQQQAAPVYGDQMADVHQQQGYASPHVAVPEHRHGLEAVSAAGELEPESQYDDDYGEEYYDDPPRGRRSMLIVGALVGAIAVGGGMAYAVKSILGPGGPSTNEGAQVVRSETGPTKVKPNEPGGRQFANTNSKVLGRLGENSSGQATTTGSGPRKVKTYTVGVSRGGQTSNDNAASTSTSTVAVPGISVVDAFANSTDSQAGTGSTKKVETIAVSPRTTVPAVKNPSNPAKPIIIAETKPKTPAKTNTSPAQLGANVTPPAKSKTKVAAVTPSTRPSSGGSVTRNGYVAVLASVPVSSKSRVKALTQFADLQQKYSSVLNGKTPDVAEVNLGTKGKYHRLLVGPPGSRTAANRICSGLKAKGYAGCWVTAY